MKLAVIDSTLRKWLWTAAISPVCATAGATMAMGAANMAAKARPVSGEVIRFLIIEWR
ncbi:hypothetical protein GCM10009106_23420 [Sphingomonas japonica]